MTKAEYLKKLKEAAAAIDEAECLDRISPAEYDRLEEIRHSILEVIEDAGAA